MRHGHLKHGLCEIDGDGRMLHVDSSLPWPQRGRFTVGTMMPHGRRSPFHRLQPTAPGAIVNAPRVKRKTLEVTAPVDRLIECNGSLDCCYHIKSSLRRRMSPAESPTTGCWLAFGRKKGKTGRWFFGRSSRPGKRQ